MNNVDSVVSKTFAIREAVRVQYRFETYNLFNHVRFAAPNSDPTSASFGVVGKTQQNNARIVQISLRVLF